MSKTKPSCAFPLAGRPELLPWSELDGPCAVIGPDRPLIRAAPFKGHSLRPRLALLRAGVNLNVDGRGFLIQASAELLGVCQLVKLTM